MNTQNNTDFFPTIDERDTHLAPPETASAIYEDSDEDRRREAALNRLAAELDEQSAGENGASVEWGELPDDAEADEKRWNELEKDFDRVFDEAGKQ